MMASIIDNGVEKGDIHHIYVMGGLMIVTACVSLFAGVMETVPNLGLLKELMKRQRLRLQEMKS